MMALAEILFEISCTQDFQILFSKGHNSEKGRNSDMKKIWVNFFFMKNTHMKFQIPNMHHSEVLLGSPNPNQRTNGPVNAHLSLLHIPINMFEYYGI